MAVTMRTRSARKGRAGAGVTTFEDAGTRTSRRTLMNGARGRADVVSRESVMMRDVGVMDARGRMAGLGLGLGPSRPRT